MTKPAIEKVTLGDQNNMKRVMDMAVGETLTEYGYKEAVMIEYFKMLIQLIGVVSQAYTYLKKDDFPGNWNLYLASVILYAILSLILFGIALVEKDQFFKTCVKQETNLSISASSQFPKYKENYSLTLKHGQLKESEWPSQKMEFYIGDYFHEDGYLSKAKFKGAVLKLVKQLEKKSA